MKKFQVLLLFVKLTYELLKTNVSVKKTRDRPQQYLLEISYSIGQNQDYMGALGHYQGQGVLGC